MVHITYTEVHDMLNGHPCNCSASRGQAAGRADVDILGGKGSTSSNGAAERQPATLPVSTTGLAGAEVDNPFLGGALRFVQNLHELSVKLVRDADGDRRTFGKSAAAKKVKRAAS